MITRTTNQTLTRNAQQNLQANMSRLAKLQEQVSSSSAITRPSDNPSGTADALKVRAEIRANTQHRSNISDADSWLATLDSALSGTSDLLNRVKDLALRGASAGLSPANKHAMAAELDGLNQDLLRAANTKFAGRSVFAGNSGEPAAFTLDPATGAATYHGSDTGVLRRIDTGDPIRVDADGRDVFCKEGDYVFTLVSKLAADLRSGADVSVHLGGIDAHANAVLAARTDVGIRHASVLKAKDTNLSNSMSLEARRSGIEDLDTAQVILDMKLQEVAYQAALSVTARVLQPTLMDFLR